MMKRQSRFLLSTMTCCASLVFAPYAFSQDRTDYFPPSSAPTNQFFSSEDGLSRYRFQLRQKRYTRCPLCQSIASQYNNTLALYWAMDDDLDDFEDDLDDTVKALDTIDATVRRLDIDLINAKGQAAVNINAELDRAEARQKFLNQRYDRWIAEYNLEVDQYQQVRKDLDALSKKLDDCEEAYCNLSPATSTSPGYGLQLYGSPVNLDAGIMLGGWNTSRMMYVNTPFLDNVSGNNSQNNLMAGLQAKLLYGAPNTLRPFLYLNGGSTFNSNNQLFNSGASLNNDSILKLDTDWIGRLGVGLDQPLGKSFSISGGLGVAAIRQSLTANIGGLDSWNVSKSQTSYSPTFTGSVNYSLCPSCVGGYGLILSGQVTVERYSGFNFSAMPAPGLNYNFGANSKWQVQPALVLSVRY